MALFKSDWLRNQIRSRLAAMGGSVGGGNSSAGAGNSNGSGGSWSASQTPLGQRLNGLVKRRMGGSGGGIFRSLATEALRRRRQAELNNANMQGTGKQTLG